MLPLENKSVGGKIGRKVFIMYFNVVSNVHVLICVNRLIQINESNKNYMNYITKFILFTTVFLKLLNE